MDVVLGLARELSKPAIYKINTEKKLSCLCVLVYWKM